MVNTETNEQPHAGAAQGGRFTIESLSVLFVVLRGLETDDHRRSRVTKASEDRSRTSDRARPA